MRIWIFLLLLAIPFANADIVISKVLYDPLSTESGGEAVEIWNSGDSALSISGWIVATASSPTDATLPDITLLPGQRYLIADEGWDEKKDSEDWRSADYEEKITLGNKDSGVAIVYNNTVLDAVGWGDAEQYFLGQPTNPVSSGKCLVRKGFSGSNDFDFGEDECDFLDGLTILIEADVGGNFSAWIENDDSNETGVQIKPGNSIVVKATGPGNVSIGGKTIALTGSNGSYMADISSAGLSSGEYILMVNDIAIDVEILPFAFITVKQTRLELDPYDRLLITNSGSVVTKVKISGQDLEFDNNKIDKSRIKIEDHSLSSDAIFVLTPGQKKELTVKLEDYTYNVPPGKYTAVLRITYGS